jgi:hypothetical protein
MSRRAGRPGRSTPSGPADERKIEALTVAMALAPGVYARNRMFCFFAQPAVQRARARAATLRGIVAQLARAQAVSVVNEPPHSIAGEAIFVLRYAIVTMRLSRVVELAPVELAALRLLASRANVHALLATDADRVLVESVLARLIAVGDDASDLARAARGSTAPSEP